MPRSGPGCCTGWPKTSTSPRVGGCWGAGPRSAARWCSCRSRWARGRQRIRPCRPGRDHEVHVADGREFVRSAPDCTSSSPCGIRRRAAAMPRRQSGRGRGLRRCQWPLASARCSTTSDARGGIAAARRRVSRGHEDVQSGRPNEFTAIRDVTFVVQDLVDKGEFIWHPRAQRLRQEHDPAADRRAAAAAPAHQRRGARLRPAGNGPGPDRGMVFQDYTSFDHRNVLDNVSFGLECQGVPRKRYELARSGSARRPERRARSVQVSPRALRRHAAAGGDRPDARSSGRGSSSWTSPSAPSTR